MSKYINRRKKDNEKDVDKLVKAIAEGTKSYKQLAEIIAREKSATIRDPKTSPNSQLREYKSWVASCVSLISDTTRKTQYKFFRIDTEEEIKPSGIVYERFSKPFRKPNDLMSFKFVKWWCQIQLDLCGMAMIYKAKNYFGQVIELWPLNMKDYQMSVDGNGNLIQNITDIMPDDIFHVFYVGGKEYVFSTKNELVYLYYPHPLYRFIGASPIQQQAYGVDIETYIEIYERDFFANSARVDMVLSTEADIGQEKADEIKLRWKERYQNYFHDIAVLGSGLSPVPIKYTNKDFEFLNLAQWSKDKILGAFRVPESKLGKSSSGNRASLVQTNIDFAEECIKPRLDLWDEECTKEILSTYDPRICIKHINPIPRDRQLDFQETRIYLAGAPSLKVNEVRKKLHNAPPVPNGDRILIPSSFIPLDRIDEYVDSIIKSKTVSQFNSTDPERHEDDKPHTNPDGNDDRDNNPTEGRNLKLDDIERKLLEIWTIKLNEFVSINKENNKNSESFFQNLLNSTTSLYISISGKSLEFDLVDWLIPISQRVSSEFYKTMMFGFDEEKSHIPWHEHVTYQMETNPRIAKICNMAIRACINYSRFLLIENLGLEKQWIINRNVCGHRGRIKNFISKDFFQIGEMKLRFPLEMINYDCDCLIGAKNSQLKILEFKR